MSDKITEVKQRDALFDNYRLFLIVLVVISHFIDPAYQNNMLLTVLKWFIVSFHMPAFIFLSGFFSKKQASVYKVINQLVIPYFVYEVVFYLFYTYVLHKDTGLWFARPKFAMWFIMALAFYKLTSGLIRKMPFHLPFLFMAGIVMGMIPAGNFLSIPRIVVYYPFFMLGVDMTKEKVQHLRVKKSAMKIIIALIVAAAISAYFCISGFHIEIFYGRYSYNWLEFTPLEGMFTRGLSYIAALLYTYVFLMIMPERKNRFSYIGERTMPIYIFHAFTYAGLNIGTNILNCVGNPFSTVALLAACLFMVWIFSRKPFVFITDTIGNMLQFCCKSRACEVK